MQMLAAKINTLLLTLWKQDTGRPREELYLSRVPTRARRSIHFNLRHWLRGGAVDAVGREEDAVR